MRYPLLSGLGLLCLGIYAGGAFAFSPEVWVIIGLVALSLLWIRSKHFAILSVVLTAAALGGFLESTSSQTLHVRQWQHLIQNTPHVIELQGVIDADLTKLPPRPWRPNLQRQRFIMTQVSVSGEKYPARVQVSVPYEETLKYGEHVKVRGMLREARAQRNPAGFDESRYLNAQQVYGVMEGEALEVVGYAKGPWVWLYALRNQLKLSMQTSLSQRANSIAQAIFLGERRELTQAFKQNLKTTGTYHLFAISGLHIGLLVLMGYLGLGFLKVKDPFKTIALILLMVIYCALVGSKPPVLRATLMSAVFLIGNITWRKSSALNSLGLAGVIILLNRPEELYEVGFILSFVAVWGLIVLTPLFFSVQDVRRRHSSLWWQRVRFYFKSLFIASLVAWLVTTGILAQVFHEFNVGAPLINMVLVPLTFCLNAFLILFAMAAFLSPVLLDVLAWPINGLSNLMVMCVEAFARLESLHWTTGEINVGLWGLGIICGWVIYHLKNLRSFIRGGAMVMILLNILLAGQVVSASSQAGSVTFFDVGQGDSILFEFKQGGTLLVDTGRGSPGGENVITPYLKARGIRKIDAVVVTHPQFDHCGALEQLAREFEISTVIRGDSTSQSAFYQELLETLKERGVRQLTVQAGDQLVGFPEVDIKVFAPHGTLSAETRNVNNLSVALMLNINETRYLLTGDLEEAGLRDLWRSFEGEAIDVLKVPHHGANLGSEGLKLLRKTRPKLAVIQVGERNRYGHPHPATLAALEVLAENVHRTDQSGALQIKL